MCFHSLHKKYFVHSFILDKENLKMGVYINFKLLCFFLKKWTCAFKKLYICLGVGKREFSPKGLRRLFSMKQTDRQWKKELSKQNLTEKKVDKEVTKQIRGITKQWQILFTVVRYTISIQIILKITEFPIKQFLYVCLVKRHIAKLWGGTQNMGEKIRNNSFIWMRFFEIVLIENWHFPC